MYTEKFRGYKQNYAKWLSKVEQQRVCILTTSTGAYSAWFFPIPLLLHHVPLNFDLLSNLKHFQTLSKNYYSDNFFYRKLLLQCTKSGQAPDDEPKIKT